MCQSINFFEVVALTEGLPREGLRRGQYGTVVYSAPEVFETDTMGLCP
jgi:Domain of unknown function (DUF4926)